MAKAQIRHPRQLQYHAEKISDMAAKLVEITDDCLATQAHTRAGDDARRMLRVTLRQLEMIADSSGDSLLIASICGANERFRENCPQFFQ